MSDFFTKKQRKFWCDKCKIFVEYSKMMIDQHNKSKIHLRNANAETVYKNTKAKFMNNISKAYRNPSSSLDEETNLIGHKISRITEISSTPNVVLEEIKKEQYKDFIKSKNNNRNQNLRPEDNSKWNVYFNDKTNTLYYFNNYTGLSQNEKPNDYDGPQIEDIKPKEVGEIGKWEVVSPGNCGVFGKRKCTDEEDEQYVYMPGLINAKKYYKKLQNEDSQDENESYEDKKSIKQEYNNDDGNKGDTSSLEKQETTMTQLEDNDDLKKLDVAVSLTIATKKKNIPRNINLFSED